jgi:hypothetical protein
LHRSWIEICSILLNGEHLTAEREGGVGRASP